MVLCCCRSNPAAPGSCRRRPLVTLPKRAAVCANMPSNTTGSHWRRHLVAPDHAGVGTSWLCPNAPSFEPTRHTFQPPDHAGVCPPMPPPDQATVDNHPPPPDAGIRPSLRWPTTTSPVHTDAASATATPFATSNNGSREAASDITPFETPTNTPTAGLHNHSFPRDRLGTGSRMDKLMATKMDRWINR